MEQSIKDTEAIVSELDSLEKVEACIEKAASGMQFHEAKVSFYETNGFLGADFNRENYSIGREVTWTDPEQNGYFSRDKEFVAEFQISGLP
jgi:predicted nucleotidyltransferase